MLSGNLLKCSNRIALTIISLFDCRFETQATFDEPSWAEVEAVRATAPATTNTVQPQIVKAANGVSYQLTPVNGNQGANNQNAGQNNGNAAPKDPVTEMKTQSKATETQRKIEEVTRETNDKIANIDEEIAKIRDETNLEVAKIKKEAELKLADQ